MADVITRLKLESGEYDSKIKRAVTGLQRMEDECRKVGGTLAILEKDQKQYVESLGRMQTVSTSVRGKIGELSSAYVELRSQYNRLTQEEKKGDFGKALSASLDQLKTRINDSKKELNDINAELGNTKQTSGATSQALEALAGKFGLNVSALTKLGGALAVAGTALKVAKDAFFQTEGNIDEWGRTVKGAEGAYDVFLQTLNNGNWSNFFKNLSTAVQGARDLYDSLDRLGSIKSNNQAAIAIVQQQIAQLRLLKQQGKNVDDQLKEATQRLAQLQGQAVSAGKTAGKKTIQQTIRNGVNSMGGAAVSDKSIQAAVGGILTNGQAEFDKYARTVNRFENYSKAQRTVTRSDMDGNRWTEKVFDINLLNREQQRQYKLAKAITNRETEIQKGIALYAQSVQEGTANAREEFKGNRYALQGSSGGGKGGSKQSPAEKAQEKYAQAQQDYNQAIEQASLEVKADMISVSDANKKKLSATETLWKAIGDAREIYDTQQLKDAQKKVEAEMINLGGVVKRAAAETKPIKPVETTMSKFESGPFNSQTMKTYLSGMQSEMGKFDIGSEFYTAFSDKLAEGNVLSQILQQAMESGVKGADLENVSQLIKDKLLQGGTMSSESMQALIDEINQYIQDNNLKLVLEVDADTGKIKEVTTDIMKQKEAWNKTGQAMGIVSQAFNAIQDPAAKIMGTVAQAIANVALAYSDAMAKDQTTKFNLFAFIAAASAATIGMISTIASIHSATGYAEGGMIKGNTYSGDQIMANGGAIGLNAGELVLNKAQQFNLASQLEGDGSQGTTPSRPYVSGEQIYLGLNNYLRRSGRGEIITSR